MMKVIWSATEKRYVTTARQGDEPDYMPLMNRFAHHAVIDAAIQRVHQDKAADSLDVVSVLLRARMWPLLPAEDQVRKCVPGSHGACPSTVAE